MLTRWQDFSKLISLETGNDDLEDIVLLGGEEDFFVGQAVDRIVDFYTDKTSRLTDFASIDYQEKGLEGFEQACTTLPILAKKRLVLVKNIDKKAAGEIGKLLPKNRDLLKLVLTSKQDVKSIRLPKRSHRFSFEPLSRRDLINFIGSFLNTRGKKLQRRGEDYANINMIIDLSGYLDRHRQYKLYNLTNDLEKIVSYDKGEKISEEAIQAAMSDSLDLAIWDMLDEAVAGKKTQALEHLSALLQGGQAPEFLISQLVRKMEQVYIVKEMTDEGWTLKQVQAVTRIPFFMLQKAYRIRRLHDLDKLKDLIVRAYQTDFDIKTGNIDRRLGLELLVLSFDSGLRTRPRQSYG